MLKRITLIFIIQLLLSNNVQAIQCSNESVGKDFYYMNELSFHVRNVYSSELRLRKAFRSIKNDVFEQLKVPSVRSKLFFFDIDYAKSFIFTCKNGQCSFDDYNSAALECKITLGYGCILALATYRGRFFCMLELSEANIVYEPYETLELERR